MTFEEILPHLRKEEKIRRKCWIKDAFIQIRDEVLYDEDWQRTTVDADDLFADDWELYQEPKQEIDWGYIIKNKCLCRFWNDSPMDFRYDFLNVIDDSDDKYKYHSQNDDNWYINCEPVTKNEISIYEENLF